MRRIFRPPQRGGNAAHEVGDELRFHLDMRTQEFVDQGMSPEDARRAAQRAFGDVAAIDTELRAEREARDRAVVRRMAWTEWAMDARFALRTLRKNAGFTVATLATLALGIGAAAAVFAVVNGVLLRPLPYPDPSRLEMVWLTSKQYRQFGDAMPISAGFYSEVADPHGAVQPLATTAALRTWGYNITSGGDAERVDGARVTPSFFSVIGVRPIVGRAFADADAQEGASPVVVLSYDLWRRTFGADQHAVGRTMELNGQRFTIVGVMPRGFSFPRGAELPRGLTFGTHTELWTPMGFTEQERKNYGTQNMAVVARLKPGATAQRLQVALEGQVSRWIAANAPQLDLHYVVLDLRTQAGEHVRGGLYLLLGAVVVLLLIACANVTNLLIARTGRRQREFAVRAALGAGRGRIARQLVTENIILAVGGSLIGLALGLYATRVMLAMLPGSIPRADDIGVDWRVALAISLVALVAGIAFGLAAATQSRPARLAAVLREDAARTGSGRRHAIGRRMLVVTEVSLSLVLLIGAGLLTVSFERLQRAAPGFDSAHVLTGRVTLPVPGAFDPARDGPGWARFFRQLQERASHIPGVEAAGAISVLPLGEAAENGSTAVVGEPPPLPGKANPTEYYVVEGDYFRAMRIKLLAGRAFDASDEDGTNPVVIVNREYARKYLRGAGVGKQLRTFFDFRKSAAPGRTIVGVVDNVQSGSLDSPPTPQVYVPESEMTYPGLEVVLRASGDANALLPALKQAVREIDPTLAVSRPRPMQAVLDESLAQRRFGMSLIAFFAAAALVLAVVGLYGVIALSVNQRRREIGVRMALGAQASDVLRMILAEGLAVTVIGVGGGLLGAYLASRLVVSLLYGVSATNVGVYAIAAAITAIVTIAATFIPARRAARVDPTLALRAD